MPAGRPRNNAKHLTAAVHDLLRAIQGLIGAVGEAARVAAQPVLGRGKAAAPRKPGQRGPGKGNPKLKAALRAYWKRMKRKARAGRIARMLKGRSLTTTRAGKRGATRKAGGPARGTRMAVKRATNRRSAWASLTPEQRAERIERMRAGRTAKPAQPAAPTAR